MAHDVAPRVDAAHANAGVSALKVDAGQARGTLGVDDTLWPTPGRRSDIAWHGGIL